MNTKTISDSSGSEQARNAGSEQVEARAPYEAPRVDRKRSVARVTLFSGSFGGGGSGGGSGSVTGI